MNLNNTVNPVKTACIFGAAPVGNVSHLIPQNSFIIAADGGVNAVNRLGLHPDLTLGDFDSLGYVPDTENVERHPVEKDDTDMGLAVKKALSLGYNRLFLFGGMGGERPDHTLSNLQTVVYAAKNGANTFLTDGKNCFTAVSEGTKMIFPENYNGNFSVFSAEGKAEGVSLSGLKYTVENATLSGDFPLGVSNSFPDTSTDICGKSPQNAEVSVKKGTLWICFQCENRSESEFPIRQNL